MWLYEGKLGTQPAVTSADHSGWFSSWLFSPCNVSGCSKAFSSLRGTRMPGGLQSCIAWWEET